MSHPDKQLESSLRAALSKAISHVTGTRCDIQQLYEVGGGSISRTVIASSEQGRWFVKLNRVERSDMFEAEADGLSALSASPLLRVPQVVTLGVSDRHAFLVLEHITLQPLCEQTAAIAAGQALAGLHRIQGAQFGWHRDNFIGSTPQSNAAEQSWPLFFARQRLVPQLERAKQTVLKGTLIANGERLVEKLPVLFADYQPAISLLHGDLWHGNAAVDESGRLALFDPAVYYGDRETDLAMSKLFGGFPDSFYEAYCAAWPLADGFEQRKTLYQLYHVLNHLNLFGSGYLHQAERMISTLLSDSK